MEVITVTEPKKETPSESGKAKLKWETARELGLDDDLAAGGDELSVREAGKIGGNMVRKMVAKGEEALNREKPAE
jgi:hypothetical protein